MAREKYTITNSDYAHARLYIEDKLQRQVFVLLGDGSIDDARTELMEMVHDLRRKGRAERLLAIILSNDH